MSAGSVNHFYFYERIAQEISQKMASLPFAISSAAEMLA